MPKGQRRSRRVLLVALALGLGLLWAGLVRGAPAPGEPEGEDGWRYGGGAAGAQIRLALAGSVLSESGGTAWMGRLARLTGLLWLGFAAAHWLRRDLIPRPAVRRLPRTFLGALPSGVLCLPLGGHGPPADAGSLPERRSLWDGGALAA